MCSLPIFMYFSSSISSWSIPSLISDCKPSKAYGIYGWTVLEAPPYAEPYGKDVEEPLTPPPENL